MMINVPMTHPEKMLGIHKKDYFHSSTFIELKKDQRILQTVGTTFNISDNGHPNTPSTYLPSFLDEASTDSHVANWTSIGSLESRKPRRNPEWL